jgi:hypothetical protein
MTKQESIYCQDCICIEQTPSVTGKGFVPVCRMYETHLRCDRHDIPVKSKECIAKSGGQYL